MKIPVRLLDQDTSERAHVLGLWEQVEKAASCACEARYNFMVNKTHRRAVFNSQMDKLCKEFSRRTENLKVIFAATRRPYQPDKENYQLKFLQLTDIPESCRNARSCPAEIPPTEVQAFGEYVSDRYLYDTGGQVLVEEVSAARGPNTVTPSAPLAFMASDPFAILDDPPSRQSVPTIYVSEDSAEHSNLCDPPLATAVVAVSPSQDDGADAPILATAHIAD